MNYSISEEQLQSLESDYMTKDTIAIIAKAIRAGANPPLKAPHATEWDLAQLEILKELYAWIQWNDSCPNPTRYPIMPYGIYVKHGDAYDDVCNKISDLQRRILPIDTEAFNNERSDVSDPMDFLLEDRR